MARQPKNAGSEHLAAGPAPTATLIISSLTGATGRAIYFNATILLTRPTNFPNVLRLLIFQVKLSPADAELLGANDQTS